MSSASSAVTYTSVYTDSEPWRVFWGADEELSDGESDLEEDPEEYEDDETEVGPVDYLMDRGDSEDDDDGDSSGDNANDEDEDEEEEEEHSAPADSAIVIPTVELVSPPEGIEPVIPPPSTDTTTTRARITVQLQAAISFPPEAEVKRLLAMPTLPPSPLTSLSPPSAGERLARCTTSFACPSPPLPPPLYIPLSVDRRDDILKTEMPPHKRDTWEYLVEAIPEIAPMTMGEVNNRVTELAELHEYDTHDLYALLEDAQDNRTCISQRVTMDSHTLDAEARQRGIGEVGYGNRDTWVDPAETVPEIAPMTMGEVNTRVTELAELHKHDTQDLYALLEDSG
nr:hypothetical protein [Tanacetum cinerariifolium]